MEDLKIKKFTDLVIWQKGYFLTIEIYNITKKFPKEEQYSLTDQLRRAGISFTSNVAEGFGRITAGDKSHFYTIALGSLFEIQSQLLVSKGLKYVDAGVCDDLLDKCTELSKMCSVLIKKVRGTPIY